MSERFVFFDSQGQGPWLPVDDGAGTEVCRIWTQVGTWQAGTVSWQWRVYAAAPYQIPEDPHCGSMAESFAYLLQACPGALIMMYNHHEVVSVDTLAMLQGMRFFALGSDEQEQSWDQALSRGMPVYGLAGRARVHLRRASKARGQDVLSAFGFGLYVCGDEFPEWYEESHNHVAWRSAAQARLIGWGGYEYAVHDSGEYRWQDKGQERYLRVQWQWSHGHRCWAQPRMIMQQAADSGQGGQCSD